VLLVRHLGRFQVCKLVRFGKEQAWVFGTFHEVFCRKGEEDATFDLDASPATNFFNDPFPFAIDRQNQWQEKPEKVGGMLNSSAANAAYEVMLHHEPQSTIVRLRHGSRIIQMGQGLGDFEGFLARRYSDLP
jgi:hypothetical protein